MLILSGGDLEYLARPDVRRYIAGQREMARETNNAYELRLFHGQGPECSWQKLDAIVHAFEAGHDSILWLDPDVEVRKHVCRLEFPSKLAFSWDSQGICCGAFYVAGIDNSTLFAIARIIGQLPERLDSQYGVYKYEQNTIKHLLMTTSAWKYDCIPQSFISNPDSSPADRDVAVMHHHWITGHNL